MNKEYETPRIFVIAIVVEKGYSISGGENNGGGISAPGWG